MKALAYVRVSTSQQAEDGVSLDAQEAKVRAYCSLYGIDLVDVVTDAGASAKTLDRPGLQDALARLEAGEATAIVVDKLDRLTRSVRDLDTLLSRYFRDRIHLVSVSEKIDTGTAAGRLVLNVLTTVAQWEREAIGERTKAALQRKKQKGERVGTVPYGFRLAEDGVQLVEDAAEQIVVRLVRSSHRNRVPVRAIAERLAAAGYLNRKGKPFHHQAVWQIARAA